MAIIIQFGEESWTNFLVCLKHPSTNWTPESTRSCHLQMEKLGTEEFIQDSWTWICCEYDFWMTVSPQWNSLMIRLTWPLQFHQGLLLNSKKYQVWAKVRGDIRAYCCNGWYLVSAPNNCNRFVVLWTHWRHGYLNALIVYVFCSVSLQQPGSVQKGSLQAKVLFSNDYDCGLPGFVLINSRLTISSPNDSFLKLFQKDGISFIVTAKILGL